MHMWLGWFFCLEKKKDISISLRPMSCFLPAWSLDTRIRFNGESSPSSPSIHASSRPLKFKSSPPKKTMIWKTILYAFLLTNSSPKMGDKLFVQRWEFFCVISIDPRKRLSVQPWRIRWIVGQLRGNPCARIRQKTRGVFEGRVAARKPQPQKRQN